MSADTEAEIVEGKEELDRNPVSGEPNAKYHLLCASEKVPSDIDGAIHEAEVALKELRAVRDAQGGEE